MSAAADRVSLFGFRLGWRAVRRMPERAAYALFDRIAVVTHRRNTTSVQRLRANYARVRPELGPAALDALTREGMRSYLRYWCDAFRLHDLDPDELARRVRAAFRKSKETEVVLSRMVRRLTTAPDSVKHVANDFAEAGIRRL